VTDSDTPRHGIKRVAGVDIDLEALRTASPRYWTFIGILGVFMALGLTAWITLLTHGGEVLSMRDDYPWGLWFVNYMFFAGISAGGLAVYASADLFGAEQFRPLARFAVLQAGVLIMMTLLGLVSDIERPWRMIWFVLTPNPTAPFVFTGSSAGVYMAICFATLWVMLSGKGGARLAMRMTMIAVTLAIFLRTTTAFVLALNKSRELWNTAVMVPIIQMSALSSGIAFLIIFAYIIQSTTKYRFKPKMFRSLSTLLATVIVIDLYLLSAEFMSVFWLTSAKPGHVAHLSEFLTGSYAPIFLPMLVLGVVSLSLLARPSTRHLPTIQLTAASLYLVAVFLKRFSLLGMGFAHNTLGQVSRFYVPSLVEILLALGILAFGVLVITLALKVLPLEDTTGRHAGATPAPPVSEAG
jgi:molybdopterin-containing oxidoreductase family membrane subunit